MNSDSLTYRILVDLIRSVGVERLNLIELQQELRSVVIQWRRFVVDTRTLQGVERADELVVLDGDGGLGTDRDFRGDAVFFDLDEHAFGDQRLALHQAVEVDHLTAILDLIRVQFDRHCGEILLDDDLVERACLVRDVERAGGAR